MIYSEIFQPFIYFFNDFLNIFFALTISAGLVFSYIYIIINS